MTANLIQSNGGSHMSVAPLNDLVFNNPTGSLDGGGRAASTRHIRAVSFLRVFATVQILASVWSTEEAAVVRDRMQTHDQWSKWRNQLKAGEVLCVSAALIAGESDRQRAEAAMIFKHKPPCNTEYVDAFPFDATTVTTSGKNALLRGSFAVQRTENAAIGGSRRSWL
jgi:hypothetical protein